MTAIPSGIAHPSFDGRLFQRFHVSLSAAGLSLAAATYFATLCNRPFFRLLLDGHDLHQPSTYVLVLSTLLLLFGAHLALLTPFTSRTLIRPVLTVLVAVNAVVIHFMQKFGIYINPSMIRNLFETDQAEAVELLTPDLALSLVLYGAIPLVLIWKADLRREKISTAARKLAVIAAVALVSVGTGAAISYKTYASFFRNNKNSKYLIVPENYLAATTKFLVDQNAVPDGPRSPLGLDAARGSRWSRSNRPVRLVVVVGETARAASFSLNGYPRNTNPRLQQTGVVNFAHVESCGTATAESLPCMFSNLTRQHFSVGAAKRQESVLDVFRHAGLQVSWLDNNSGCKHVCDGVGLTKLDHSKLAPYCSSGDCYDRILLHELEQIPPSSDSIVVLHQKGSHGPAYWKRYPPDRERFVPSCHSEDLTACSAEEIRNAYDNTIAYTDELLADTIDHLRSLKNVDTALLYISDHGESLGERGLYLHGFPYALAPDVQTHVPMVFWSSDSFAKRFEIDLERLRRNAAAGNYSHDNLFHSLLGALDIRTAVYEAKLDVFRQ